MRSNWQNPLPTPNDGIVEKITTLHDHIASVHVFGTAIRHLFFHPCSSTCMKLKSKQSRPVITFSSRGQTNNTSANKVASHFFATETIRHQLHPPQLSVSLTVQFTHDNEHFRDKNDHVPMNNFGIFDGQTVACNITH
mmetsp:Transcript_5471/g.16197  ORF Transcript_5471/g.16197 Transcript_5471/m.16197 type:complete len:138 (+) Transcript_5471:1702-2115(+)